MNWINKASLFILIHSLIFSKGISTRESYHELFFGEGKVHATLHISNLVRHGIDQLTQEEISKLSEIGLINEGTSIIAQTPSTLNETYETDHFRFNYTLDSESIDKVDSLGYVILMGQVFEQVWKFFGDTLGYDAPPGNPNNDDDKYDVFIVNLPSNYFGVTYTTIDDIGFPSCVSYIKMRNSYSAPQFSEYTEMENIKVTAVHEFFTQFNLDIIAGNNTGLWKPPPYGAKMNSIMILTICIVTCHLGSQIQIKQLIQKVAICMGHLYFFNTLMSISAALKPFEIVG